MENMVATASHSTLLTSHVEFAPSENDHGMSTNMLKTKYRQFGMDNENNKMLPEVHMNGQTKFGGHKSTKGPHNGMEDNNRNYLADGIPQPKVQIYNPAKIHLEWIQTHKIGAGLINAGNTCFLNTVLQCLTYCPPLANYLLFEEDHCSKCKLANFCLMCEMQKHMRRVLEHHGQTIKPISIFQKLRTIAKHFQFGKQEDAHEFLRYVIDHLWKSSVANYHTDFKLDPASKETTVINYIFGGYNRSQVICLNCQGRSNTYDHFMDFILDIKNVHSLEGALKKFIEPEMLEDDNAYKCPKCGTKVRAEKKFTVHRAPNVATFQFKRFDYNRFGSKITKNVTYPEKLDLRPYMSDNKGSPIVYKLFSVLVHMGHTCNSGHYYCFVRNSNGLWYIMDDTRVTAVSQNQVLSQQAYVLFYVKVQPASVSKGVIKKPTSSLLSNKLVKNGPQIGPSMDSRPGLPQSPYMNHHHSCISNSSSSISNSNPAPLTNGKPSFNPNGNSPRPNSFTNNHHLKRDKISFDIKRPLATSSSKTNGNVSNNYSTYRPDVGVIVKGSEARQKSVPKTTTNATNSTTVTKTLVPYAGDSSETDDERPLPSKGIVNGHCGVKKDSSSLKLSEIPLPGEHDKKITEKPISLPQRLDKFSPKMTLPLGNRGNESLRVKSSLNWNVLEERNHSPSITSNSSNCSVNSTTDWNVTEQENSGVKKERGCIGWSIKSNENNTRVVASSSCSKFDAKEKISNSNDNFSSSGCGSSRMYRDAPLDSDKSENFVVNDSGHRENGVVNSEVNRLGLPPNSFPGRGEPDHCERQSSNREPHGGGDRTSPKSNSGFNGKSSKTLSKSENNDSRVIYRKRWRDDANSGNEESNISLFKKYKTVNRESVREPVVGSTAETKHCNGEEYLNSPCDNHAVRRAKKKGHRKRCEDESSSSSYEWIEKTKETVEAEKTKFNSAPSKLWDADIRGGYKRSGDDTDGKPSTNGGTHWDGSRKSDIVSEILEISGKGHNSSVNTWDGSQSTLDKDSSKDFYRKRHYSDDYDDEFDKGKVKKIKKRYSEPDFKSRNPFQEHSQYNRRNRPNNFNEPERFSWNRNSQSVNSNYNNQSYSYGNRFNDGSNNRYQYRKNNHQNHNRPHHRNHHQRYSR